MKKYQSMMLLISITATFSLTLLSCDSYERKMAKLEKVATEFKATLNPNNQIIAEQIDSIAQKVFYLDKDEDGNLNNIKVHDYTTNETKSILPESGKIEDFEFCNSEFKDSKLIKDRLFLKIQSPYCMWEFGSTGVFFINVRDNSLHYVESCNDAMFLENGEISITKFYYLGFDDDYGEVETDNKQYTLLTSLSDEAYADNRREQKRIGERLAEEWRNRDIERIVNLDYTTNERSPYYTDHANTLNRSIRGSIATEMVFTNTIVVPQGKVWQFKRFTYSGYSSWHTPRLRYYKVVNGELVPTRGKEMPNDVQIVLYPGTYIFSITDMSHSIEPGHRKAKIIFTEKWY